MDDYSLCLDEHPRCRALLTAPNGCNQPAGLVSVSLVTDYVERQTNGK